MLSKFDKAWVALAVSFIAQTAMQFWGVEVSVEIQATVVSVITAALVFLVPNKPSA